MICLFVLNKSFCPLRAADCLFSQLGVDFEVVYFDKRSRRSKFNKLDRSKDEMTKKRNGLIWESFHFCSPENIRVFCREDVY